MSRYQRSVFGDKGPPHLATVEVLKNCAADLRHRFEDEDADQLSRAADKLEDCCRTPHIYVNERTAAFEIMEYRCKSRLCLRCGKARAMALKHQMLPMVEKMNSPRILVLTPKSNDDPLADQIKSLVKNFAKLRRTKPWIAHFIAGFYCIEVTHNNKTNQWHPHIHCIVDGRYWYKDDLSQLWHKVTGDSFIIDLQLCKSHDEAVHEVTKYNTKTQNIKHIPAHRIAEWALSVKSMRFINTFGGLRKAPDEPSERDRFEGFTSWTCMSQIEAAIQHGHPDAVEIFDGILKHAAGGAVNDGSDLAARREAQRFRLLDALNDLLGRGPPKPLPEQPITPPLPPLFPNGPAPVWD